MCEREEIDCLNYRELCQKVHLSFDDDDKTSEVCKFSKLSWSYSVRPEV